MDDGYDGVQYQVDFATQPLLPTLPNQGPASSSSSSGDWQTLDIPFSTFTPNFRGRPLAGQAPFQPARMRQLGLMVSKFASEGGTTPGFKSGPFRLAIRSIRGFV